MVLNTYWLIQVLTIITKMAFHSSNLLSLPFMFFVFCFCFSPAKLAKLNHPKQ